MRFSPHPLPLLLAGLAFAQTAPNGTPLGSNGLLMGATTEVGASDKEGIVNWKDAAKVKTVIGRDFGLVQTTAYPTWGAWNGTSLSNVSFDISPANQVIDWAHGLGKKTELHLLAGSPTYFPSWLDGGSWTPAQLDTLLNHWITFATTNNGNGTKVDYWNVVNEAFMWNGSYWDSSSVANTCPWQKMGWEPDKSGLTGTAKVYAQHPIYIRRALELARQHTQGKLELRDYGNEFWDGSIKCRAFYQLVKHLVNSGVPIDAVGLQCHFRTDMTYDWSLLKQAVQEYRKLGLEVYLTEVDYGDTDPVAAAGTAHRTPAWDTLQARNYHDFAKAATSGGANWICLWGVADNTNTYWRMGQSALLYDESYAPKYSYYQFRQGIVDGLATTSVQGHARSTEGVPQARFEEGRLAVENIGDGSAQLVDLRGNRVASVEITGGSAALPPLAPGLYLLCTARSEQVPLQIVR
ncbi:MAG TPA: endo-1,4-beta-xylanase [Fibrobacteria bacterium]|nr:endo-1,4-beta-xylanase [Fibrobacteria bacterium]